MLDTNPRPHPLTAERLEQGSNNSPRRVIDSVLTGAEDGRLPPFAATLSMSAKQFRQNMKSALPQRHFSHELSDPRLNALTAQVPDAFHEMLKLLLEHAAMDLDPGIGAAEENYLARVIAAACFGQRHLWQDLGLSGRAEVSELLDHHFPSLARKNHRNLRWKRFLFAELGALTGKPGLLPQACALCPEQPVCHQEAVMA